jgi:hypothetical protein
MAIVLALSGALLAGCGGGTKTVSVSGAAAPPTTADSTGTARTNSTAGTSTGASTQSTTEAGNQSAGGTAAGGTAAATTRTAPAPAFTHTGTQSSEASPGAQAAAASSVVLAHGYTPVNTTDYRPTQTLRVLLGTRTGSADGYNQRAFFFIDGHYIGTDSSQPSAALHIVSQSDTEVALAYALYRPHDAFCCPSGGQAVVHFQLNNGRLVPLQPIPPTSSASGLARQ